MSDERRGPTGQDGATCPIEQQLGWLYAERSKEMSLAVEERMMMEIFMDDAVNYVMERKDQLNPFFHDKIPFSTITARLKEMREEGKMDETDKIALSKLIKRCEKMKWEYKHV